MLLLIAFAFFSLPSQIKEQSVWRTYLVSFGVNTGDLLFEVAIHANCIMHTSFVWINPVSTWLSFIKLIVFLTINECSDELET